MSLLFLFLLGLITYFFLGVGKKIFTFTRMAIRAKYLLKDCPGPPSLPLIGSVHLFKVSSLEFAYQLEDWGRKYIVSDTLSGLIIAWVGPVPVVICATTEAARPILESNLNITKPVQYDIVSDWIGTGLLTSTGSKWFSRRKMLTPTFHFNILQRYQDIFALQADTLAKILEKEEGKYFDIFPYIKRCALEIICQTAMGTEMNCNSENWNAQGRNSDYVNAVSRITAIIWDYQRFPWLWLKPIWYATGLGFEFDRLVKLTNDFTRSVIAQRKQSMELDEINDGTKEKLSFLDLLLKVQEEKGLTDEDIREEVDTFMFEGHDTTSSGMGFTLWWIGQLPRVQQKIHEELDEIFGDSDRLITNEDVKKLIYLEKCIKEGLRLFPSVPLIGRRLENDLQIGCFTLPKDMTIVVAPLAVQRDPRFYEFPDEYYPEHFDAEKTAKRDPYAYIPFSAGPRNCIGQKFAIMEEKTVLASILRKYNIETQNPWPQNRPVPEIILKPVVGFNVKVTPRQRH